MRSFILISGNILFTCGSEGLDQLVLPRAHSRDMCIIHFLVNENGPSSRRRGSYEMGIVITQDQPCYFIFLKVLYGKG